MRALHAAEAQLRTAEDALRAAVVEAFPIGMRVRIRAGGKGGYIKGTVREHASGTRHCRYLAIERDTPLTRERRRLCKKMMFWQNYQDLYRDLDHAGP